MLGHLKSKVRFHTLMGYMDTISMFLFLSR